MTDNALNAPCPDHPQCLWQPTNREATAMHQFMAFVNQRHSLALDNYPDLYQWSCTSLSDFWRAVWDFTGIEYSQPPLEIVDETASIATIPSWFVGARFNFAENLLRYNDDRLALVACGEHRLNDEHITRVTYRQLRGLVARAAYALKALGVQDGDRVAGYLPNSVEAVVMMLAATSLGAIWCSTSPDFGTVGVLDRFAQIQPTVLVSVNAIVYNDKVYDHLAKVQAVVAGLPEIKRVILVPFVASHSQDYAAIPRAQAWPDFMATAPSDTAALDALEFAQLPFDHPVYILFSSGTTGLPKCLVHSAGGMLLQHLKEHRIHGNMTREDVLLQYTTTGWMMWNWMVSALALGATVVLYDGSPFKPTPGVLWQLMDQLGVTMFGTSAKYIQSLQAAGYRPKEHHALEKLHSIYSTGSPLKPESFDFVYQHIKADLCLGSITGGTDICSLFAAHNTAIPVYRGEIQCRGLGMAIEAWDAPHQPLYNQSGDLVCTKPFPCMPVYFWNDPDGAKYRAAYFDRYPNTWYHGDFVWINQHTGGIVMLGRSDGTLNPSGVRFGSAELYNIIDGYEEVADSLAVGQKYGDDERVVLFLKMKPNQALDPALVLRIKQQIRAKLSPRHVPAFILAIADIPYTVNGKKVEVIVKKILSNQVVVPSATLANPECLKLYQGIPELQ
ncbi:hypothetical protein H4R34_003120 [Dimargaris verticillata]|uniref:Acetoacetate--CoA ligase n=1 Tax=Dimargaris verticillata TaxID=2761393 RepID=A0A9W8E8J7_9FUNG|nr:hypothetical protein H4R34_003120 [Dimargaris verticillata]